MQILTDAPLIAFNTFGLQARAAKLVVLESVNDLPAIPELVRNNPAFFPLGGGSNVLFAEDYQGLILQNALKGKVLTETEDAYHLRVMGGESWPQLVDWTLQEGLGGLENLALIPGTAGAAPIQNIGAYGLEFADRCEYVEYLDLTTGDIQQLNKEECQFGYRDSVFKQALQGKVLITAVGLYLPKPWQAVLAYAPLSQLPENNLTPQTVADCVKSARRSKLPDPKLLGNAGSFFKNPTLSQADFAEISRQYSNVPGYPTTEGQVKIAAAWLIDQAGWKGKKLGAAGVHHQQALVLVNHGQAKAEELLSLARQIRDDVKNKFGVTLTPEVRLIGQTGEISL
ncbi:UDP-N-acetylmuramate dehydrogenase [Gallaecimonas mangrovi]|uniref:UDP-N-acetylmuramate dehydrogenase n=1 Tax=Gallaecimonas mangrovi TaxID=2291597 RepID=UPI000E20212D|nr:UDP-N-acetylmuramate dehydrogenase [Gallaecimonas mangrovi]